MNTRLFKVCFSYLLELCKPVFGNQLEYCNMRNYTGKRVNPGGGYGLKFPCQYLFKGNLLAVKWLGGRLAKEKKIVEDALARNQERKTGSIEEAAKE